MTHEWRHILDLASEIAASKAAAYRAAVLRVVRAQAAMDAASKESEAARAESETAWRDFADAERLVAVAGTAAENDNAEVQP